MKALTFEQYFKAYEGEEISLLNTKDYAPALARHLLHLQQYHDFVCQDFRPEMILDLFEGVNQLEDEREFEILEFRIFINNTFGFVPYSIRFPKNSKNAEYLTSYYKPKTLNDFISDCSRSGIELQWKEGVWHE